MCGFSYCALGTETDPRYGHGLKPVIVKPVNSTSKPCALQQTDAIGEESVSPKNGKGFQVGVPFKPQPSGGFTLGRNSHGIGVFLSACLGGGGYFMLVLDVVS